MENFTVLKKIGEGGYGQIFIIRDKRNGKKYVAKLFHQSNKKLLEKQYTNLTALGGVCKDYFVCPVGMIVERNGKMYLLMDYLEGYMDLFDLIVASQKDPSLLTIDKGVSISKKLVKALRVLHSMNIVHRDIKPENIMIDPKTLDVRFIDFGLACVGIQCHMENRMVGTPQYMAPELLLYRNRYDTLSTNDLKRTDLFSLGLVIALLCNTGHVPVMPFLLKKYKFPNNTTFFMHKNSAPILDFINKKYIQEPLKCTSIHLLALNPGERTLGRVQCQQVIQLISTPKLKQDENKKHVIKRRRTI